MLLCLCPNSFCSHKFIPRLQFRSNYNPNVTRRNSSTSPASHLKLSLMIRLQSNKGYARLGHIYSPAKELRSYLVEADGAIYRRNRPHILPVKEQRPATLHPDVSRFVYPPTVSPTSPLLPIVPTAGSPRRLPSSSHISSPSLPVGVPVVSPFPHFPPRFLLQ